MSGNRAAREARTSAEDGQQDLGEKGGLLERTAIYLNVHGRFKDVEDEEDSRDNVCRLSESVTDRIILFRGLKRE